MLKRMLFVFLLVAGNTLTGATAFAAEPTLQQVYQSAEAGRLNEAQTMMSEVLSAHPNSGKAHYVEAELLAKQGQFKKAEVELANAERLSPGLPFAKPQAVRQLRDELGAARPTRPVAKPALASTAPTPVAVGGSSLPWGLLLGGIGLIAFIAFAARLMAARSAPSATGGSVTTGYPQGNGTPAYGSPQPVYSAGGNGGFGAAQGPSMGSRVLGGLATGAAVGAGVVAGEALMHRFMGERSDVGQASANNFGLSSPDAGVDDMGGADFGVSDASSWDDSASSGDSDWS